MRMSSILFGVEYAVELTQTDRGPNLRIGVVKERQADVPCHARRVLGERLVQYPMASVLGGFKADRLAQRDHEFERCGHDDAATAGQNKRLRDQRLIQIVYIPRR
jgi:hypothetical protein